MYTTSAPVINANVKCNLNPNPNLNPYPTLLEKKRFFGCPTGGTFKGSLNGSKWFLRTIFRTFLGSLELFLVIYGTCLGSWTCKEPFWKPFFPRVLNTGQKGFQVAPFFFKSVPRTKNPIITLTLTLYCPRYHGRSNCRRSKWRITVLWVFTLKTPGSEIDPERVHWGPNSIPGQRWPGNQSTWRGMWPRAGSIWLHCLSNLQKADQFPGHLWPGMEFGPKWTLFRVTLTRVFLIL